MVPDGHVVLSNAVSLTSKDPASKIVGFVGKYCFKSGSKDFFVIDCNAGSLRLFYAYECVYFLE